MKVLKVISKALTILWCIALILIAIGLFIRKFTFYPDNPILAADYTLAIMLLVLVVFSFLEKKGAFVSSSILFIACGAFDGWGLLIKGDTRCWPGALVALFGVVYISVKVIEKKTNETPADS